MNVVFQIRTQNHSRMSRRIRQGIKDIEKEIADFERTVQKVKPGKSKPVDHHVKRDKQLKPFVTEPVKEVVPKLGQKSNKEKLESREIHKQVLESKNATVVITVKTKHSHVSKKKSKMNASPCRSKVDARSIRKEGSKSSHSAIISKEASSVNKDREANVLPWSSLLNNRQLDYETCSSVYSECYQPNNIQSERSTMESKYVYKKNCSTFAQRQDYELKTRVDQSVQCTVPQCECPKTDSIGELKSLFTEVLSTLQKNRNDSNMERNLNRQKSFEEEEPVRLPRTNDSPKRSAGFTPLHPAKASPPEVISAPIARLPTELKTDTASSSPGSMQKQLEMTNLLLEHTYREIALKCEEYRKERDQLREEVIQQQKKVQALMENEKDHLLVINSLQADINRKTKKSQHTSQETSETESPVVSCRRNSELEMELQLLRLQSEKYQTLMAKKEKEIARFRQELQSIQGVIQEQLDNCKLIQYKATSDEASSDRKEGKPVTSSPTSSAVTLGTLESWQKISCISPSTVVGDESDIGVVIGEKLTVPDVKLTSPKQDTFHSVLQEAAFVISDTESVKKARKEVSKVFEEIRNSRFPLPSPPRTYTDLNDSHWTDLSVETKTGGSLNDTVLTQATDDKV